MNRFTRPFLVCVFLIGSYLALFPCLAAATVLFADDFELPNWTPQNAGWDEPDTAPPLEVSSVRAFAGSHSAQANLSELIPLRSLRKQTDVNWSDIYIRWFTYFDHRFRWPNEPGTMPDGFLIRGHTVNAAPQWQLYGIGQNFPANLGTESIQLERWYCMELHVKTGGPGVAVLEGWIDDVQRWDYRGNIDLGSNPIKSLDLASTSNASPPVQETQWIDELVVADARVGCGTTGVSTTAIFDVVVMSVSSSGATIRWSTKALSDSQVEYGLAASYGELSPLIGALTTTHTVTLSSLLPARLYHFQVRSRDASGKLSTRGGFTFRTEPNPAPTALVATAVSSTRITTNWQAPNNGVGVTGYKLIRCAASQCADILLPPVTTYTDTLLKAETTYVYWVTALYGTQGYGSLSIRAEATTPAFGMPTNLVATAATPTQVNLSWTASSGGAHHYEVWRSIQNGPYILIAQPSATTYSDTSVNAGGTYFYRVRGVDETGKLSAYTPIDFASTFSELIVAGVTFIKAQHIMELRQAVDALRASVGLTTGLWTDPVLAGNPVRAVHIQELRTALNLALGVMGRPMLSFTDPQLIVGVTPIKSVHLTELRFGLQ